jgi:hypothetical protein
MRKAIVWAAAGIGVVAGLSGCARSACCGSRALATAPVPAPSYRPEASHPGRDPRGDVLIQASVFRMPQALVRSLSLADGTVSKERHAALEQRLAHEPSATVLQMPAVLAIGGEEATLFAGQSYAIDGREAPSQGFDVDMPNWAGQRWRIVATPSADRARVALDVSFAMRDRPPEGVKPDLTALAASGVRASVVDTLAGDDVLVVLPRGPTGADRVVLFVKAKALPPEKS